LVGRKERLFKGWEHGPFFPLLLPKNLNRIEEHLKKEVYVRTLKKEGK